MVITRHSSHTQSSKSKHPTSRGAHQQFKVDADKRPKRVPTVKRHKIRTRGQLKDFMKMPLDIVLEIFSHLLPLDILRLARSTKFLRSILMSKASRTTWEAARGNVPTYNMVDWGEETTFPKCPPDLSEPEYASLVFEMHCLTCGVRRACKRGTNLASRSKDCMACLDKSIKLQRLYHSRDRRDDADYHNFVRFCSPDPDIAELPRIYQLVLVSRFGDWTMASGKYILNQCMVRKEKFGGGPLGQEKFDEYLQERLEMMDSVKMCSSRLSKWYSADGFIRPEEQRRIREERLIGPKLPAPLSDTDSD